MIAVHRGRQTADHAVLATIKDLVTEAQVFMERSVVRHVVWWCWWHGMAVVVTVWRYGIQHSPRRAGFFPVAICGDFSCGSFFFCRPLVVFRGAGRESMGVPPKTPRKVLLANTSTLGCCGSNLLTSFGMVAAPRVVSWLKLRDYVFVCSRKRFSVRWFRARHVCPFHSLNC